MDKFVDSVSGLGDAIRSSFGKNVGQMPAPVSAKCEQLTAAVQATGAFDTVVLQEDLTKGQTILNYTIELQDSATKSASSSVLLLSRRTWTVKGNFVHAVDLSQSGRRLF